MKSTKILEAKGIKHRVIILKDIAISVQDVVDFCRSDINSEEICKTIICKTKSGKFVCVFLRGKDKIDFKKLKQVVGEKVSTANPEEIKQVSGVEPGAVCPLLLKIPIFVDKRVLQLKNVNIGSGNHLKGLEIGTKDLLNTIEHKVAEVVV